MTKKTVPSKTGGTKSKPQSPTIHSSISSSQSQKKPLAPSPSRDSKSGESEPRSPAPEMSRPTPMQVTPGVIGGAALGAQAQTAEYESRMASLHSRWESVAGRANLASLYGDLNAIPQQLHELQSGIADLRAHGYRYGRGWETQITALQGAWAEQREKIARLLEDERQDLETASYDVNTLLNRAAREPGLLPTADSRVSDFERRVREAEQHVTGMYESTRQAMRQLQLELAEAQAVVEALESASFQLFPDESGLHVCKAEWHARGAEPFTGLLFLTDSRLLFEKRQEVVTKKMLFFNTEKKLEQELLWSAPIGGVSVISMEDKKELLRARKELLVLQLEGSDAPHEVTLNLVDARNEDWARLIKRAQEGQFDFERAEAASPAALPAAPAAPAAPVAPVAETSEAAAAPLPTKCPSCGAALPTLYKGMREIRCAYCDTLIRLS
ncbi:MAG TPA: hypothetical protein PKY49_08515 [Anaerolineae bacterium]|nr:hypothetical protein [Anaerolineae bacterium]